MDGKSIIYNSNMELIVYLRFMNVNFICIEMKKYSTKRKQKLLGTDYKEIKTYRECIAYEINKLTFWFKKI